MCSTHIYVLSQSCQYQIPTLLSLSQGKLGKNEIVEFSKKGTEMCKSPVLGNKYNDVFSAQVD